MKNPVPNKLAAISLLAILSFGISGCGGGSAGTGTTSFQGKILTPDNQPVEGAVVTVVGTGETAVSDEQGRFSLDAEAPSSGGVALQVQAPEVNATVNVPVGDRAESKVGVQLEVNSATSTVTVRNIEVKAEFVGACKSAFARSGSSFIQAQSIADETTCTIKIRARERGAPLGGINTQLQRRRCDSDSEWHSIASRKTSFTGEPGTAELKFRFFNDEEHCRYRIVAPAGDRERPALVFEIGTLRQKDTAALPAPAGVGSTP